jgi:hypothetical protein
MSKECEKCKEKDQIISDAIDVYRKELSSPENTSITMTLHEFRKALKINWPPKHKGDKC